MLESVHLLPTYHLLNVNWDKLFCSDFCSCKTGIIHYYLLKVRTYMRYCLSAYHGFWYNGHWVFAISLALCLVSCRTLNWSSCSGGEMGSKRNRKSDGTVYENSSKKYIENKINSYGGNTFVKPSMDGSRS